MARLNEPPAAAAAPGPSAETVEVVKRRYLRQNRELAKTNSQQSVRIRCLETETSRLLAENLSLREQVLQLQNNLEAQSNRPSVADVDAVKSKLEAKLLEFGGLVAELAHIQNIESGPKCKSQTAATRRSPEERQWRSGLGLQEVENAMLPTITEDKYFPRRTMNADEIRDMLEEGDSQSPDIGPPPVSRFENEDPIAFDPHPMPQDQVERSPEDAEPALSVNFETRKKRRESGPKINPRRMSLFESPPDGAEERSSKGIRAGAKRKFTVQEDEAKEDAQIAPFTFSRRHDQSAIEDPNSTDDARPQSPERPVLGSKPVNTDPTVSPKKQRSSITDKPNKKPLPSSKSSRGRLTITRTIPPELPALQLPEPIPTAEIHLEALPPKTPAVEEIFSPPSTEPSTARPEAPRDTPPPSDLSSTATTALGGRPSRRARPQVSYKEPSLNAKMRRPGQKFVDAVQPQNDGRTSTEPNPSIKRESVEKATEWKSLPLDPNTVSGGHDEVGSPLREKLGRKESQDVDQRSPPVFEQPRLNSSAASKAISALIAGSGPVKKRSSLLGPLGDIIDKDARDQVEILREKAVTEPIIDREDLAIFDFTDSSPADGSAASRPRIDLAKASRNARRHSSVPSSHATEDRKPEAKPRTTSSQHLRTGSDGGVKSASTTSLGRSTSSAKQAKEKANALPNSRSTMDLKAAVENGSVMGTSTSTSTSTLRAERAASRRKSMMI
ncbi:hypothetical protein K491DRAFT_604837 [Lophiostoma macrostomum CBS 122681]|uniref:Shugoshin n=1 Tax=Lophiostoma macrostomum CBS 122681 TaxID=1314788 RepID=A0A6A6T0S7_9PLEO|nr:hypothetical protein K491DRAFT_604837 [Lophiostoma macrostomum CBS 122681]